MNKPIRLTTILRSVLFLVIVVFTVPVQGQIENHLILKKNGFRNKLHFLSGDPITFIRNDNPYAEESYIQGIGTNFIIASGQEIPLNEITCVIHRRTGFNFAASGKALMIAAPGYLVIGVANALFQGISPVPTVSNLVVAGSLLTTGLILPKLQVRKFNLGKKFTLRIVQSDPALGQ